VRQNLIFSAILASIPLTSSAQELRPLSEYLSLPADRQDQAYPYLRCIGLFQGFYRYGGANLSDEDVTRTQLANEAMGLIALLFRQQKNPNFNLEKISAQLGKEIEDITHVYHQRMTLNYNMTGEAFGSDAVIGDDFETCGGFAQDAVTAISNFPAQN